MRTALAAMIAAVAACSPPPAPVYEDTGVSFHDATDCAFPDAPAGSPAHAPWPRVFNLGFAQRDVRLVTIAAQNDPIANQLFAASDEMLHGAWWDAIAAEYFLGTPRPNARALGPAITHDVSNAQMRVYIADLIAAGTAPAGDGDTMFLLYLPPGVAVVGEDGTTNTDCSLFGGYHDDFRNGSTNTWAVVQRCPTPVAISDAQQATEIGSHELIEAITDPEYGNGYSLGQPPDVAPWQFSVWQSYGPTGVIEIGDLCEGTAMIQHGVRVQRMFSNCLAAQGGDPCTPPSSAPYYNVSEPTGWHPGAAGTHVVVPLTPWSTAPTPDWSVFVVVRTTNTRASDWSPRLTSGTAPPVDRATTNVGSELALDVAIAPGVASGAWAVIEIISVPGVPLSNRDPARDAYHFWLAGVYVR